MRRVMVLSKDNGVGSEIQGFLEKEDFSVIAAPFTSDSVPEKETSNIDVFLVDIASPDGDGLDLVPRLRENSGGGIIILSAQTCEASFVAALEMGADDCIGKPVRPRELAARINALCRRTTGAWLRSPVAGAGISVGGYRLIPESRSVLGPDGQEIALTTAEYNIFSVLAHHQGKVLTRDEIIGLSKGRDWRCYERSVDGLISRLRRKLPATNGASHFIKTVHGSGYTIARS